MWTILVPIVMEIQVAYTFQIGGSDNKFHDFSDTEILDYLVDKSKYDKRIRPTDLTYVNVSMLLLSLYSEDESSLKYEIEFLLHQKWFDPRLRFNNSSKYQYLNGLLHIDQIWLPDIYFIKHGEFKEPPVPITLSISSRGSVAYSMRINMVSNCQGNFQIFPFDNLRCPFALENVYHKETEVQIKWSDSEVAITGATSLRQHNAYLIMNDTGECDFEHTWRGDHSCLRVLLTFTRDKSFYISSVFLPGVVLVTSSFISFWLDIDAVAARVTIGVTTMLSFCTTTSGFRSTLPVVSNLTAMNLWDSVCLFFIYTTMLEFIIVNYLYSNSPQTPNQPVSATELLRNSPFATTNSRWALSDTNVQSSTVPSATTPNAVPEQQELAQPSYPNHQLQSDTAGTVASKFTWLRRPQLFVSPESCNRRRFAKYIDTISKGVFPFLFVTFTTGFVLVFAIIKPSQQENWRI